MFPNALWGAPGDPTRPCIPYALRKSWRELGRLPNWFWGAPRIENIWILQCSAWKYSEVGIACFQCSNCLLNITTSLDRPRSCFGARRLTFMCLQILKFYMLTAIKGFPTFLRSAFDVFFMVHRFGVLRMRTSTFLLGSEERRMEGGMEGWGKPRGLPSPISFSPCNHKIKIFWDYHREAP